MSTDENRIRTLHEAYNDLVNNLNASVHYLRKPYMDHPLYGMLLEEILRQTIIERATFLTKPYQGLTPENKTELAKIFGEYDQKHGPIMEAITGSYRKAAISN